MDSVSTKEEKIYGNEEQTVVVIDTGAKFAIIRNVRELGYRAVVVPWDTPYEKIMSYNPKGIVLSSGPGDPQNCPATIETTKQLIENNVPTLGICLGAQIIGIAGNTETYKLKYGHRGQNKPCVNLETNQVYVTSQNHGYGIKPESLEKSDFNLWFTNADDKTVEGIKHKTKKCIAVQFHPEAVHLVHIDCEVCFFEELKELMEKKMPKNESLNKILVLGSGAIKIGEAGEFDYSGSQCLKAIHEDGLKSVLINPNIATIQTDTRFADQVYLLPVNPQYVESIVEKERPDGIMLAYGGQTSSELWCQTRRSWNFTKIWCQSAWNTGSRHQKHRRQAAFKDQMTEAGVPVLKSRTVTSFDDAKKTSRRTGLSCHYQSSIYSRWSWWWDCSQ